jgi:hypothetical protein
MEFTAMATMSFVFTTLRVLYAQASDMSFIHWIKMKKLEPYL